MAPFLNAAALAALLFVQGSLAGPSMHAVNGLAERILGTQYASQFSFELMANTTLPCMDLNHQGASSTTQPTDTSDCFELSSPPDQKDRIHIRGTSISALTSGLGFYLREYGQMAWDWSPHWQTRFPNDTLIPLIHPICKCSSFTYRYYLNVCTFSYSMAWWHWDRWQRELDWMALHGINTPLAMTGQEYIWSLLFQEFGVRKKDLRDFFGGPAFCMFLF
jgi:hypothetical protein